MLILSFDDLLNYSLGRQQHDKCRKLMSEHSAPSLQSLQSILAFCCVLTTRVILMTDLCVAGFILNSKCVCLGASF